MSRVYFFFNKLKCFFTNALKFLHVCPVGPRLAVVTPACLTRPTLRPTLRFWSGGRNRFSTARTPPAIWTTCSRCQSKETAVDRWLTSHAHQPTLKRKWKKKNSFFSQDTWGTQSFTHPLPTSTKSTVGAPGTCRFVCGGGRCTCGTLHLQANRMRRLTQWSSCRWRSEHPCFYSHFWSVSSTCCLVFRSPAATCTWIRCILRIQTRFISRRLVGAREPQLVLLRIISSLLLQLEIRSSS